MEPERSQSGAIVLLVALVAELDPITLLAAPRRLLARAETAPLVIPGVAEAAALVAEQILPLPDFREATEGLPVAEVAAAVLLMLLPVQGAVAVVQEEK